jgi:hypothetical protein
MLTAVHRHDVALVVIVLPGDELKVHIYHTDMRNGNIAITSSQHRMLVARSSWKVLEGSVEVSQHTTVRVFTGGGFQEAVDIYSGSPTARTISEGTNTHLLPVSQSKFSRTTSRCITEESGQTIWTTTWT